MTEFHPSQTSSRAAELLCCRLIAASGDHHWCSWSSPYSLSIWHAVGVAFSNQYQRCRAQPLGEPKGNVPKSRVKFCLPYYNSHISGLKFCSGPLAGASLPQTMLVPNKHPKAGGGRLPCQIPNSCSLVPSISAAMPVAVAEQLLSVAEP